MLDAKIQTFLKVCETMNYTDAAEELHLTQPAVSKHIRALEDYYGTKLFRYRNRKLSLTREGEFLMKTMAAMERDSLRIRDDIRLVDRRTRIRFGATRSIGNYSLVARLNRLIRNDPDIDVSVTVADTAELLAKMEHGELDFIICEGNFRKADYEYSVIRSVPLNFYCHAGMNISEMHSLTDLMGQTLILREQGSGTREIFEHYLAEHGYSVREFRNYHEINSPEVILKVLEAGNGVSVLYEDVCKSMEQEGILKRIPLDDFHLEHDFTVIWKKDSLYGDEYRRYAEYLMKQTV